MRKAFCSTVFQATSFPDTHWRSGLDKLCNTFYIREQVPINVANYYQIDHGWLLKRTCLYSNMGGPTSYIFLKVKSYLPVLHKWAQYFEITEEGKILRSYLFQVRSLDLPTYSSFVTQYVVNKRLRWGHQNVNSRKTTKHTDKIF